MNAAGRRAFFRRALFVAWGMVTLVLLFCVGLLAYQMVRQRQAPLVFRQEPEVRSLSRRGLMRPGETREILLYFASADGRILVPQAHTIEHSGSTVANCRRALEALIEGSRDVLQPIMPPDTGVRGLYMLDGGELVIDFSREVRLQEQRSASSEALMIYGVVNTLTQNVLKGRNDSAVTRVSISIVRSSP